MSHILTRYDWPSIVSGQVEDHKRYSKFKDKKTCDAIKLNAVSNPWEKKCVGSGSKEDFPMISICQCIKRYCSWSIPWRCSAYRVPRGLWIQIEIDCSRSMWTPSELIEDKMEWNECQIGNERAISVWLRTKCSEMRLWWIWGWRNCDNAFVYLDDNRGSCTVTAYGISICRWRVQRPYGLVGSMYDPFTLKCNIGERECDSNMDRFSECNS